MNPQLKRVGSVANPFYFCMHHQSKYKIFRTELCRTYLQISKNHNNVMILFRFT